MQEKCGLALCGLLVMAEEESTGRKIRICWIPVLNSRIAENGTILYSKSYMMEQSQKCMMGGRKK